MCREEKEEGGKGSAARFALRYTRTKKDKHECKISRFRWAFKKADSVRTQKYDVHDGVGGDGETATVGGARRRQFESIAGGWQCRALAAR